MRPESSGLHEADEVPLLFHSKAASTLGKQGLRSRLCEVQQHYGINPDYEHPDRVTPTASLMGNLDKIGSSDSGDDRYMTFITPI